MEISKFMLDTILEVKEMREIIFMSIEKYVYFYEKNLVENSISLQPTKKQMLN